jgi:predicted CoA-binding protein
MSKGDADDRLVTILREAETIAVIGASAKEARPSHQVMHYLQNAGYRVIPVNPGQEGGDILGEKVYARLKDIDEKVDIVDIFRRSEFIGEIVDEAIETGAGTIWMQLGISNEEAADKARNAGLRVVMDRCTKIEHARLIDRINRDDGM